MAPKTGSVFRAGVDVASLAADFASRAGRGLNSMRSSDRLFKNFTDLQLLNMVLGNPRNYTSLLKKIDSTTLTKMFDGMTDAAQKNFLRNADQDIIRKLNPDSVSAKIANDVDVRFPDGSTKSVKYGSPGFWNAVSNGATILGGLTLLAWIDKKFEEAEEEYKNCMAGCLPHNWDEYDSGTLDKSKLKYSTVETLKEHGLEPIDNQPYCKKTIKDCGKFCDEKCEKETEVDLPGSSAATGILDKFRRALESFLPDIPGVDPTIISFASSASSMLMFMLIIMQFAV